MEKVTHRPQTPAVSRRTLLGAAAAVAGGASGVLGWTAADAATAREVEALKAEGWEAHPCACMMCGGYCGLLAMHKKGAPVSQETVRIMPNPTHPQRGCCARGASAMWVWNHPLRLKKPLKRVGERGEGKFKEVTWDEALDDIAARVKKDRRNRRRARRFDDQATTTRAFRSGSGVLWAPPNIISHSSTCNSLPLPDAAWFRQWL